MSISVLSQALINIQNRIIPVNMIDYPSFINADILTKLYEAMAKNDYVPTYLELSSHEILYHNGQDYFIKKYYIPFDVHPSNVRLSNDFLFTRANTSDYYSLKDIAKANLHLEVLRANNFVVYATRSMTNEGWGLFSTLFLTTTQSHSKPIDLKVAYLDEGGSVSDIQKYFGYELPLGYGGYKFIKDSPKNYNGTFGAPVECAFPKAVNFNGLIIRPSESLETDEILPYYNKTIYYANPAYGYYDNYYDVSDFRGVVDPLTNKYLIEGTLFACGFEVVWLDDNEFWITRRYKMIYQDYRQVAVTRCCLAECFGITE